MKAHTYRNTLSKDFFSPIFSLIYSPDLITFLIQQAVLILQLQVVVSLISRSTLICAGNTCNAALRGKPLVLNSACEGSLSQTHTHTVRYSPQVSFKDAWGRLGGQNHTLPLPASQTLRTSNADRKPPPKRLGTHSSLPRRHTLNLTHTQSCRYTNSLKGLATFPSIGKAGQFSMCHFSFFY